MKKRPLITTLCALCALAFIAASTGCLQINSTSKKDGPPHVGDRYEIVEPIYITGVYNSLNNKTISKDTAKAYLNPMPSAKRIYYAFSEQIPAGTIMTITSIESDQFVLDSPLWVTRRLVELEPDPSHGLEVILRLSLGMEGELDGLNPKRFRKLPPAPQNTPDRAATAAENKDN